MRDYQIKIEPFEYIALQEFTINRTINEHVAATLTMRIKDEWKEKYTDIITKKYERPNDPNLPKRQEAADIWYAILTGENNEK